MVWKGQSVL